VAALVAAIGLALAFALTNGFHDAANAIALLVATRAARPGPAVAMAAVCNMIGPLLLGAAVANTIATIVTVDPTRTIPVVGAGLTGAVAWNTFTWRKGLPSSSGHALVGGLVGAAILDAGVHAVRWGGLEHLRPVGVFGTLIALAVAPVLGFAAASLGTILTRRAVRRATVRWKAPIRRSQWVASAWLAFSHGSNDAQKSIGIVGVVLLAHGTTRSLSAPAWVKLACAGALTLGTAMGGWAIIRTMGRRIFRMRMLDGVVGEASSAGVILLASFLGAPVSTTQVVAASVVGIGTARRRHRHVNWGIVTTIGLTWLTTPLAAGVLAAAVLPVWRSLQ
jgi:PiT family inorganic phosphate transporter